MNERFAGRFLLLRRLGAGGMGEVYLARDTTTGLECALKRLHLREDDLADTVRHEFEALTRVRHPAVVAVYEFGISAEGTPFYTMEYVPGLPSDHALAQDDRPSLFSLAARVAHGLEVLHAANVVHGDLKPANLVVLPGDRPGALPRAVRIVDFGLARLIGRAGQGHVGTPGYAAPEVVAGEAPTPASDLYGLGATLYTILARRPPFPGETRDQVLQRQQAGGPSTSALEAGGVPGPLIQLVLRLMARSPGERPRDAREVRRALETMHPAARRPLAERIEIESIAGRDAELARFEAWWSRKPARPRLMILTGVSGAGKSALLSELATRMTLAGRPVIHVSCAAFEDPHATAVALARRIAAEAGADADETLGSIQDRLTERDLDVWVDAVAQWSGALARSRSELVVMIDDAERLDHGSRAWIRRLVSSSTVPIVWLWARRRSDRPPEDEAILIAAGLAERVELEPLSRAGLARLAATRLGDSPAPALEEFLWSRCAGHPGLAVDLLRRAATGGAIVEEDAAMRIDAGALAAMGVPADYEASLLARCDALDRDARALTEALAVWGAPLPIENVGRLVPSSSVAALERVLESGLASRLPNGDVELWPPLLADRLVEQIDPSRRRELHRAALEIAGLGRTQRFVHLRGAGDPRAALAEARRAIEEGEGSGLAEAAAGIAEREVPEEAAEWHERAARHYLDRRLFVPAAQHLRRALELEPEGASRSERWVMLCRAAQRTGQPDRVFQIVEDASREDLPAGARARMIADESMARLSAGQRPQARERAMEALRLAEGAREAEAEGVAAQVLGYLELEANRLDIAEDWAKRATEAFEQAGRPDYARAVSLRAALAWAQGRTDEAADLSEKAIESARKAGDRHAFEDLHIHLSAIQIELGRWDQAIRSFETIARIGIEDARLTNAASARAGLSVLQGLTGRISSARRSALETIRLARIGKPRVEPAAFRALAQSERIRGRLLRAERAIEKSLSL
ncbi:MAG: NACHT domain-containing protein, partial [Candidatus Eisenbacteria bacterium]